MCATALEQCLLAFREAHPQTPWAKIEVGWNLVEIEMRGHPSGM